MFTSIKAKNFRSIKNIELDLKKNSSKINNFIAIYGENGSGKTNITELFEFLLLSILNKSIKTNILMLDTASINDYLDMFANPLITKFNYHYYRTKDEQEPTEIEYNFEIDGIPGCYYIKFLDEIIEESLSFRITTQRNFHYNIYKDSKGIIFKLNDKVFVNEVYNKQLYDLIKKYWSKYSFLSIINSELEQINLSYLKESIIDNFFKVFFMFKNINIVIDKYRFSNLDFEETSALPIETLDLKFGFIANEKNKKTLLKYEEALKLFFIQAYSDIIDVKYDFEKVKNGEKYRLFIYKKVSGRILKIDIKDESSGTIKLVNQFKDIISCTQGHIVIIDEIDNGIHDILMKTIIESILPQITGQLIITTHNTALLEITPKENVYILGTDAYGFKRVNSINDFDFNVQKNNNLRNLYLKGVFGGIPLTDNIFFEDVSYILEDTQEDNNIGGTKDTI